jgi:hypothetical protein
MFTAKIDVSAVLFKYRQYWQMRANCAPVCKLVLVRALCIMESALRGNRLVKPKNFPVGAGA